MEKQKKKGGCLKRILLGYVCFLVIAYGALYILDRIDFRPPGSSYICSMFTDIHQLQEKLAPYEVELTQDPYSGDMICDASYCSFVEYEDTRYRVTGYVFPDVLSAAKYYTCNVWGKKWNEYNEEVLQYSTKQSRTESEAFFGTKHAVFHDRSVLVVETKQSGTKRMAKFENWLTADFPLKFYTDEEQEIIDSLTK